jgi:hypothetical protein
MNYEQIGAEISVHAEFSNHKIRIVDFVWKQKTYKVDNINMIAKARRGRELVWVYYVSNIHGAYKLRFDTEAMQWWLDEVTWEE